MPTPSRAILSLTVAATIWGTAFVVTKAVLPEVPPFLFALLRNGVASVLLLLLALGARASRRGQGSGGLLALMGLTGVTLYFAGQTLALQYTSASAGALIQGTIPALTAALGVTFLGERLGWMQGLGIAVSILGVGLVVLTGSASESGPQPLLGNLLMLGACLCWAIYTVLAKRLAEVPPLALATHVTVIGTLLLVPLVGYEVHAGTPFTLALTPGTWLAALYLGVFASGLSLVLWSQALRSVDASVAGNFINLVPVVGVAAAALLLGERPAPAQLLGGGLVLVGVWLSARRPSSTPPT